jgi:general secretion pathway protein L
MAISTSPPSFLVTLNRRVTGFWQWWTGELAALVPRRLKMAFAGDASLVDVVVDATSLVHVKANGAALQELKRVSLRADDANAMRLAVEDLVKSAGRDIRLLVSPSDVLRKKIVLPLATEENLLDVVGFDMDRQTPFTADQVYFGARVLHRDTTRERLDVSVAVVPRAALEPHMSQLRAAGVFVHSIVVADEIAGGAAPTELLPKSAEPSRRWSNMQRLNVGLIVCGLLFALAAVVLPIWQKRETVKELIPLTAKVGAEYKVTQKITDEYTRLANEYNFIAGKKHSLYPTVMLVDEITKISPDTTWIQNFELKTLAKTRELQLTGEAVAVSKVIESLEQTAFLQNTAQRSQTRQGSRPNIEFFTLASEVKPRPLPEAKVPDASMLNGPAIPDAAVGLTQQVPVAPSVPTATVTAPAAPANGATKLPPAPNAPASPAATPKTAGAPPVTPAPQSASPQTPSGALLGPLAPPPAVAAQPPVQPNPAPAKPAAASLPAPPAPTSAPGAVPPRPAFQLPYPGSPGSPGTGAPAAGPTPPPPGSPNSGPPLPSPSPPSSMPQPPLPQSTPAPMPLPQPPAPVKEKAP